MSELTDLTNELRAHLSNTGSSLAMRAADALDVAVARITELEAALLKWQAGMLRMQRQRDAQAAVIAEASKKLAAYWRSDECRADVDAAARLLDEFSRASQGAEPECKHGITLSDLCAYATTHAEHVLAAEFEADKEADLTRDDGNDESSRDEAGFEGPR